MPEGAQRLTNQLRLALEPECLENPQNPTIVVLIDEVILAAVSFVGLTVDRLNRRLS